MLPSKTKENTFHVLNRTIWTRNKALKLELSPDPTCLRCEALETIEHLLYICDQYSIKIWTLLGWALMLSLSRHTGEYIPAIVLTLLEIVLKKPHPSILLHLPNSNRQKVVFLPLQKVKKKNYHCAYKFIYSR
jgi:hypothetical protein